MAHQTNFPPLLLLDPDLQSFSITHLHARSGLRPSIRPPAGPIFIFCQLFHHVSTEIDAQCRCRTTQNYLILVHFSIKKALPFCTLAGSPHSPAVCVWSHQNSKKMESTGASIPPPSDETAQPGQSDEDGQGEAQQEHRQEQGQHQTSSNDAILPLSDGTPSHPPPQSNDDQDESQEQGGQSRQPTFDDSSFLVQVSESLPSPEAVQSFLSSPSCGAISTFTGVTRDNFAGKRVARLSYEGYVPMAIKELRALCRDAKAKYATVDKLVAAHILGECPVGEASVVVGSSSPHRREALRCTEYLIDELKGRVPIWKKEIYEGDEESVWKENVEWREGRMRRVMVREEKVGEDGA